MDCRRSALLAVGLVSVVLGCTPQRTLPLTPPTQPLSPPPPAVKQPTPQPAEPTAETKPLPKRDPKAATCVALGLMREHDMESPDRTPMEREMLADRARKAYQQALRLDPKHVPAYQGLARLQGKLNQTELAIETYHKAQKIAPEDPELCCELGMCHSRLRQWEPALEALRKACELDPENRPYAQTYAYALARAGRPDDSLDVFQKVVGPAQAHYNLARMLIHLEDLPQARQHLTLAVQLDAKLTDAQELLTQIEGGKVPVVAPDTLPASDSTGARRAPGRLSIEDADVRGNVER